ncbi:VTT domain-containing protein [Cytophagaceae bacterium ABcell3]|nr:VTT domain-containing protein [Cytophagaceae bacterium ABcell3]
MSDTQFKKFLLTNLVKGLLGFALIIAAVIFFRKYSPEGVETYLEPFTSRPLLMFLIFFTSETIIGIIPPEFFIVWSLDDNILKFISYVLLLSVLSFSGAVLNYGAGRVINKNLYFQKFARGTMEKYAPYYYKWGGWVIVMASFTPIPYATISLVSGALNYPVKSFFIYALSRFLRFGIYSWIIFNTL